MKLLLRPDMTKGLNSIWIVSIFAYSLVLPNLHMPILLLKYQIRCLPASSHSVLLPCPYCHQHRQVKETSIYHIWLKVNWFLVLTARRARTRMAMGTQAAVGNEGSRWATGLRRFKSICGSNFRFYFLVALPVSMEDNHQQREINHRLLIDLHWEKTAKQTHLKVLIKTKVD